MKSQIDYDLLYTGNKRAVSRAISLIESGENYSEEILNRISSATGRAFRIGLTGPPGAGKSSLTNQLTKEFVNEGKKVGIIAVDPTSPFTGGALLGDRVRMSEIGTLENVYIRSLASRGSLGGLSSKANDAADIIDAAGYDIIIFETVGVGQSELDIAKTADTTAVVLVPESGDSVQAMKAGLMEIADIFILNKSDRPGSDNAYNNLISVINLSSRFTHDWEIPVLKTVATESKGIKELKDTLKNHFVYLSDSGILFKRREYNSKIRIREIIERKFRKEFWNGEREAKLNELLNPSAGEKISPYQIADKLFLINN